MIWVDEESEVTFKKKKVTQKIAYDKEIPVDGAAGSFYVVREYRDEEVEEILLKDGIPVTEVKPIKVIRVKDEDHISTYYKHEKELLLQEVGEEAIQPIKEAGW